MLDYRVESSKLVDLPTSSFGKKGIEAATDVSVTIPPAPHAGLSVGFLGGTHVQAKQKSAILVHCHLLKTTHFGVIPTSSVE